MKSAGNRSGLRLTAWWSVPRFDAVERGEIGIEQHLVFADDEDLVLDALDGDGSAAHDGLLDEIVAYSEVSLEYIVGKSFLSAISMG